MEQELPSAEGDDQGIATLGLPQAFLLHPEPLEVDPAPTLRRQEIGALHRVVTGKEQLEGSARHRRYSAT